MTALVATTDQLAGVLFLGIALGVLGACIIRVASRSDEPTTPTPAKQARLVAASRAAVVTPVDASSLDALFADLVLPEQRRPGAGS